MGQKKRYALTLTVSNVERFQAACKQFGLPASTMSKACDDIIKDLCGVLEKAISQGKFSIKDLFDVMGQQLELLYEEEKNDAKKQTQKATRVAKKDSVFSVS